MNPERSFFALGAGMGLLGFLSFSLLGFSVGCHGEDPCPEDGTPCGGDLTGRWNSAGLAYCRNPVYKSPDRLTYLGQPQTAAREPLPEATSSDWCSYLVYGPTGITGFQFPYDTPGLGGVRATFDANGTYSAQITALVHGQVDIPRDCLTRFGVKPICGHAEQPLTPPARSLVDDLIAFSSTAGSYQLISCSDAADGGCHCSYEVDFDPTVGGTYTVDGTVLSLYDSNKRLPSLVDYCVAGDTMTFWGHNRATIWDQVPGIRTIQLARTAAP